MSEKGVLRAVIRICRAEVEVEVAVDIGVERRRVTSYDTRLTMNARFAPVKPCQ
jgi:hypothetical protein